MPAAPPLTHEEAQREFAETLSGFTAGDKPDYADYSRCIHCGLCLNACPTYRLWHNEADSPRGRIRQMALIDQGRLEFNDAFVTHIDRCLDCRACETACPSGVEYGKLVELARAQIARNFQRPRLSRFARRYVFERLLPNPRRIARLAALIRLYQRSGLEALARGSGILRLFGLQQRAALLPRVDSEFFFSRLGKTFPAKGPRRARVAFFAGCVAQVTFTELNDATIRVLQANGCEVVVPADQFCCGALAAHAGERDIARDLARKNISAFLREPFDAIITNAAGCGSTLKEYTHLFSENPADSGRRSTSADGNGAASATAAEFSSRVRDVTEFLAELGLSAPLRETKLRVTYQDSCHLAHGQQIREAPRKLIRAIPGVELIEMPLADHCCGSAGIYNVTETAASMQILAEKMHHAKSTAAPVIVTANPGCILQLRAGAKLHKTNQQVLHVVELLDRASAS
ncbi:MAG TPA: (Fe-S)-binding protein [Candidatus Acidoferrales bacterium]|nr:(Fe-S)-binding protein [Candidatus Acidoferrales bacterium]